MARWDRVIRSRRRLVAHHPGLASAFSGASAPRNGLISKFTELYGACGKAAGYLCFSAQIVPQSSILLWRCGTSRCSGEPRPVLDRVSLTLRAGERLAVVGPSGAGKSTVLRLLAGLQLPTSGELRLFNKPQTYLRLDQNDPPDVRLVFQNPALLASLTVEENVGFLLRERAQLSRQEIRNRVQACLEAVGLYDVAHLYAGELSGGMQKRVSFARALIDDPDQGGSDDAFAVVRRAHSRARPCGLYTD